MQNCPKRNGDVIDICHLLKTKDMVQAQYNFQSEDEEDCVEASVHFSAIIPGCYFINKYEQVLVIAFINKNY